MADAPDLAAMRAENEAAWRRDIHLSDYASVVVTATARYLPALEARVEELENDLRIANDATLVLLARAAAAENPTRAAAIRLHYDDRGEHNG